ncbi:unnamed protein product [Arabis nemorensis]|uniref:Uncharacterized protein n=1 Tax=Arabis nemorensis TaxID=586526 RepID=A0A565C3R6_9BRAS|nr:unnamed protein product [Arabis nemorensis]
MSQIRPYSTTKPGSSGGNSAPPPIQKWKGYEVIDTKKACVYRVDLPGCHGSDLSYSVDSTNVHFFADELAKPEYNYSGRKYGGTMHSTQRPTMSRKQRLSLSMECSGSLFLRSLVQTLPLIPLRRCFTVS